MRNTYANRIIKRAIELLDRPYAWTKGRGMKTESRAPGGHAYCMLGALLEAHKQSGFEDEHYIRARDQVAAAVPGGVRYSNLGAIVKFNDRRSRKKQEVLDVLREALV